MKNRPLDNGIYNLAAGIGNSQKVTQDQFINTAKIIEATTNVSDDNRIWAVYPTITQEAFAMTMDNYRIFISSYNFKTEAENQLIEKYNATVDDYKTENPNFTPIQKTAFGFFIKSKNALPDREYNDEVEKFNNEYGLIFKKRKIQTVKYGSEQVFQNFLHLYNTQLLKRNQQQMLLHLPTLRKLQRLKISSQMVVGLKRNDVKSIDVCKKTIRSHRKRLEEAGVLVEYHFSGGNRAVKMHINSDILVVLDMKTSKIVTAENQRVTPESAKVLPDSNENTRTLINKDQIKENVENNSLDKEFPTVTPFDFVFYENTTSNKQNPTGPPPKKYVKFLENAPPAPNIEPTQSEKLTNLIIDTQELAVKLSEKEFLGYTPIPLRDLEQEAYHGTMTNDEFRELVIQDFFKSSSKIWRDTSPWPGAWKKAINLYYEVKFCNYKGISFNKSLLLDDVQELRWRLEHARKWFLKNNFPALFPSQYFDITRTTAKEVGFEYTKKAWLRHQKYKEESELRKRKTEAAAALRKSKNNHAKKAETIIKRYINKKIDLPYLFDYVEKNLPPEFMQELPKMIEKITLNLKK